MAILIAVFFWLISRLWFIKHIDEPAPDPQGRSPIYAHWHGDELLLAGVCIGRGMAVMTSLSKDGQLMTRVLSRLGFRPVRGSSSRRGAAGLKALIDLVAKDNCQASLAVDGPRGPIYRVKPGVLKLAQQTGHPIIAGAAASNRRHIFVKAWNQCYLPLPFSKSVIFYGQPVEVPRDITAEEFEELRVSLEETLQELKAKAETHFNRAFEASPRNS